MRAEPPRRKTLHSRDAPNVVGLSLQLGEAGKPLTSPRYARAGIGKAGARPAPVEQQREEEEVAKRTALPHRHRSMGHKEETGHGNGGEKNASGSGLLRVVWILHRWQSSSSAAAAPIGSTDAGASSSTDQHGRNNNANDTAARAAEDSNGKKKPLPRVVVVEERRCRDPAGPSEEDRPFPPSPAGPDEAPPPDVPCGCCAVYVGAERRRFVVPTAYLDMPVFARLLEKAEDEFGFDYRAGPGITIPCDTEAFKYILLVMDAHRHGRVDDGIPLSFAARGPGIARPSRPVLLSVDTCGP